jgi:hypothetical protein
VAGNATEPEATADRNGGFRLPNRLTPQPLRHATREQDLVRWSRLCVSDVADMAFEPELQRKCVWPRRGQLHCVSLGARLKYLRSEIFAVPLLLMSRIQSGDGAARTNAKHEEHKPFSHGSPPPLVGAFQSAFGFSLPI